MPWLAACPQGRAEAERRAAEDGGWAELARLEQQAARAAGRADRLKQLLYFPEAKGYRWERAHACHTVRVLQVCCMYVCMCSVRMTHVCSIYMYPIGCTSPVPLVER